MFCLSLQLQPPFFLTLFHPHQHTTKMAKSRGILSPMSVALLVVLLSIVVQVWSPPSVTGKASPKKVYNDFQSFYPFYQSQHATQMCRVMHFIGTLFVFLLFLWNLRLLPSLVFSCLVGYLLCPMLIGLEHGFFELGAVLLVFLLMARLSTGKFGVATLVPLIGYGFAWFGHFYYEKNVPATFIYPTYSLFGDFLMFFRICTQQETF